MGDMGATYLSQSFERLAKQTFQDFEIVISDQSKDGAVKDVCNKNKDQFDIRYFQNTNYGNWSDNINNAIKNAHGNIIKILFLDDLLYRDTSLEEIVQAFDLDKDQWLVTSCIHSKDLAHFFRICHPSYNDETILMKNTIGSPSVMAMRNDNPLLFDTNILWSQDVDYYKRYYDKFGPPKILKEIGVIIRVHKNQVTHTLATEAMREKDYKSILKKYHIKNYQWLTFCYKIKKYKKLIKGYIKKAIFRK